MQGRTANTRHELHEKQTERKSLEKQPTVNRCPLILYF